MAEKRFNKFFAPKELPGQLNKGREGNVMCAAVVANMWAGGVYNKGNWMNWISNGGNVYEH